MLPPRWWAAAWVLVVTSVPTFCRGWKWVEAQSWELTLFFRQRLRSPSWCHSVLGTLVLRADTWQVHSSVITLVQFYCYPHWEFLHHCLYALIGINNYYSAPDSAFPSLTLMSSSDLDLNSLIICFQRMFSTKSPLLLVTWFVIDIDSSPIFWIPPRLHACILVLYVQFRCLIICLTW